MSNQDDPSGHLGDADRGNADAQPSRVSDGIERWLNDAAAKDGEGHSGARKKRPFTVRIWHSLWKKRIFWHPRAGRPHVNWAEKVMACVTVAILIVGATQAYIYWKQSELMQDSLSQNERSIILGQGQIKVSSRSAAAADTANQNAKNQFRADERPYITLAGAGDVGKVSIATAGEHAGHLAVEIHLTNYGKSPGIETARDARLAIGSNAGKQITLHEAKDRRGRIIPPGARPSIYAYSDGPVNQQMFDDMVAGKMLVIAYGHIDYTDILGDPRPQYSSEFCGAILANRDSTQEADEDCKNHEHMK
jgi:hypothetical protein